MGRPELQFQNFTRGGLKVELCQSEQSLRKLWHFRNTIFRGGRPGDDRDIWDEHYLNFCIKSIDKNIVLGCFRLGVFPSGAQAVRGYSAQFFDLSPLASFDRPVLELGVLALIHCAQIPMFFAWLGALSCSWSIKTTFHFYLDAVHLPARNLLRIAGPFAIFAVTTILHRTVGARCCVVGILWCGHWKITRRAW